jgi:Flp pilus assembly protein TadD
MLPGAGRRLLLVKALVPHLALVALVAVTYANAMQNSFVWDDHLFITGNPAMRLALRETPRFFVSSVWKSASATESVGVYYRPLVVSFFWANSRLWGQNPVAFHAVTLLLHMVTAVIVYRIGLLLLARDALSALLAAAIFAVHPVHNEVLGRAASGEVLFGLLSVLTLFLFARGSLILSLACFSAALLAKESAVMLPVALAILAVHRQGLRRGGVSILPYALLTAGYLGVRALVLDQPLGWAVMQPPLTRVFTMASAAFDYARLLLVPYPLRPFYPAVWHDHLLEATVLGGIALVMALGLGARRARKDGVTLFLLASPGILLAPVIWQVNRFPVGFEHAALAERFLYAPAIPAALLAGLLLHRAKPARRRYLTAGALLVIAVFAVLSARANRLWKNDLVLFRAIARSTPEAVFPHVNLGYALRQRGDLEAAAGEFRQALSLMPENPGAHVGLGMVYQLQGRFEEAIMEYRTASALLPEAPGAQDLGVAYSIRGRREGDAREDPGGPRTRSNSFAAHLSLGMVFHKAGQLENALSEYRLALGLDPASAEAHNNLGVILWKRGQRQEALREFEAARRLQPDSPLALQNLEAARRGQAEGNGPALTR